MPRLQLAQDSSKALEQTLGRPLKNQTPIVIRSFDKLGSGFEHRIRTQIARRIEHATGVIERITVRFEDVNGPKGGIDKLCRIKAVLKHRPSIVVEKRADCHPRAFALAVDALGMAVSRVQRKHSNRAATHRARSMRAYLA